MCSLLACSPSPSGGKAAGTRRGRGGDTAGTPGGGEGRRPGGQSQSWQVRAGRDRAVPGMGGAVTAAFPGETPGDIGKVMWGLSSAILQLKDFFCLFLPFFIVRSCQRAQSEGS